MRWIPLALTIPLVLLITIGGWLVMGERQRVLAALQTEARQWANLTAHVLGSEPTPTVSFSSSHFHDGISPSSSSTLDSNVSQLPVDDLKSLLDQEAIEDTFSSSGLPLKPLVIQSLLSKSDEANQATWALALLEAVVDQPSQLSARLAQNAATYGADDSALMRKAELATEAITVVETRRPDWSISQPWTTWQGTNWHADFSEPTQIQVTSEPFVQRWTEHTLKKALVDLPTSLAAQFSWRSRLVTPPVAEPLAEKRVGPYQIAIGLRSQEAWNKILRDRLAWMIGLLVLAGVATGTSLWLTWRTLRKQASLAALQSDFIASVSHELRTPVASIGVLAERLESDRTTAEQSSQYHHFIARETRRLAALIDNILDFSRIEQGRKCYTREPSDLSRLVLETVELLRPRAEETSVVLETNITLQGSHPAPDVDALALRQALVNLIDNAIKFSPKGQNVCVCLSPAPDGIAISVHDKGPGIDPKHHKRIFERFYRIDGGLRRETRGAGIGLSVVEHILQAHGGHVSVQSSPPKEGATFTMHLPSNHQS